MRLNIWSFSEKLFRNAYRVLAGNLGDKVILQVALCWVYFYEVPLRILELRHVFETLVNHEYFAKFYSQLKACVFFLLKLYILLASNYQDLWRDVTFNDLLVKEAKLRILSAWVYLIEYNRSLGLVQRVY